MSATEEQRESMERLGVPGCLQAMMFAYDPAGTEFGDERAGALSAEARQHYADEKYERAATREWLRSAGDDR